MKTAHCYTFGIEEEFFLADAETLDLSVDVPRDFIRACRRKLGDCVHEEMKQAQVEISTPILANSSQARAALNGLRGEVGKLASERDMRLIASGTHPFAGWREHAGTDAPRYDRLMEDFQIVGQRNFVCGLHVHVAPPVDVDRVALMNRLMPWTPLLLALSSSSPFWGGRSTGLMSYRQAAYDEWPRSGIPDAFEDQQRYDEFVDLLAECGALENGSFLWWAIRPSTKFPTLELRLTDACTRVEDSLALAAAFRCLVRAHVRDPELGSARSSLTRRLIDENRWRAKRFGVRASFIDEARRCEWSLGEHLREFCVLIAPDAAALGCEAEIRHLAKIARLGSSADVQLAIYRREREGQASRPHALHAVVDWLADATAAVAGDPAVRPDHRRVLQPMAGTASA